jgi:hypothetical protein
MPEGTEAPLATERPAPAEPSSEPGETPPRWTLGEGGLALVATLVGQSVAALGSALTLQADGMPDRLAFFGLVLLGYALPAATLIVLARRKPGNAWRALGFRPVKVSFAIWGVVAAWLIYFGSSMFYILAITAVGELGVDVSGLSEQRTGLTRMIDYFSEGGAVPLLLTGLVLVVIAPVVEEAVFRGVIQPAVTRRFNVVVGVLVSGLLFAAIHFDAWGLIQLAILGILLGVLARLGKSIWPSIALHALVNTQALLLVFAVGSLDELTGPLG